MTSRYLGSSYTYEREGYFASSGNLAVEVFIDYISEQNLEDRGW